METSHAAAGTGAGPELATYSPAAREVLRAVRDLIRADRAMRREVGVRMNMNSNELLALRRVLEAGRQGEQTTPGQLASFLDISTAATTTLLDGLVGSGHLKRLQHPSDRRSKVLVATPTAHALVHAELGRMHERMSEVAHAMPAGARPAVIALLRELAAVMEPAVSASTQSGDRQRGVPQA